MAVQKFPSSAQFFKFRDGKLIKMRAILDSFDIVEHVVAASQSSATTAAAG